MHGGKNNSLPIAAQLIIQKQEKKLQKKITKKKITEKNNKEQNVEKNCRRKRCNELNEKLYKRR